MKKICFFSLLLPLLLCMLHTAAAQSECTSHHAWNQRGGALRPLGVIGSAYTATSVAVSSDGNTIAVGAPSDNNGVGAVFTYTRNDSSQSWEQFGEKLIPDTKSGFGGAVALSFDGTTLAVGANNDINSKGSVYVFVRNSITESWKRQGPRIADTVDHDQSQQGYSVALSADGNTLAFGGTGYQTYKGATWVYARNATGGWNAQAIKLIGTGGVGNGWQGSAVALSAEGNILASSGTLDNGGIGAVWMFIRNQTTGTWNQHGGKLTGSGGGASNVYQGTGLSMSTDGGVLAIGANADQGGIGSVWVFERNVNGIWNQRGEKIRGPNTDLDFGYRTSLSSDGSLLAVGAPGARAWGGAVYLYQYNASIGNWTSVPATLVGLESSPEESQGSAVALSGNGEVVVSGAPYGMYPGGETGAFYVFENTRCENAVSSVSSSSGEEEGSQSIPSSSASQAISSSADDSSSSSSTGGALSANADAGGSTPFHKTQAGMAVIGLLAVSSLVGVSYAAFKALKWTARKNKGMKRKRKAKRQQKEIELGSHAMEEEVSEFASSFTGSSVEIVCADLRSTNRRG